MREIEINNSTAGEQLVTLGELIIAEMEKPSCGRIFATMMAWALGAAAVYVYYSQTLEFTKNDTRLYSHFAIASSMISNAVVNGYFNGDGVKEAYSLKDPVTGKMTVPCFDLWMTGKVSLLSALAFAFLVLDDTELAPVNFFFQLITYTAQHYFSVMTIFKLIRKLISKAQDKDSLHAKNLLNQKINGLLSGLIDDYSDNKHAKIDHLFFEKDKISLHKMADSILNKIVVIEPTPKNSFPGLTVLAVSHLMGLFAQSVGNVGYFNSTINGYRKFFDDTTSIVLGILTMCPMFWLSFYVSINNVNRLAELVGKIAYKIWTGKSSEIWDEFHYAIRKAPWFSSIVGSGLTVTAIFSFYTALELLLDAIYNLHPQDNPAWFGWMDSEAQSARIFYTEAARFAIILFNVFPVPDVLAFLARTFCYVTGSSEERKALSAISFLEGMSRRVSLIPEYAFGFREVRPLTYLSGLAGNGIKPARKNCCTRITECFSWLFRRSPQPQPINGHSINGDYHPLNGFA